MAFFVGSYPPSLPQDAPGGFLGLFNKPGDTYFPPSVAVEFDSFRNIWDPNSTWNHLGVDVNSIKSLAYAALPDGSFNGTMSAWVRYDASASSLSATLRFDDLPPGLGLYNVTATVDFMKAGLPQDAAVGFSGATGDYVERHQILSWSFESTLTSVAVHNAGSKTSKPKKIGLIAGLASSVGILILLSLAAWPCYRQYLRRRAQTQGAIEDAEAPLDGDIDNEFEKGTGPRRFSYIQLLQATRGFSDDNKLGEGGFGSVYRGFLQDHVAIKRVSKTLCNLVQLVGWCHENDQLLLVYELMTNGSLDTHLYSSRNILTWPIRYKIILGVGSAVLYLHQECEQCVVHRDIKPSNVMLDSSFNAKLGDFGLARLVDHSRGAHTTMLAGTKGYMDPESVVTGRASAESDVYSFGVVLLELVCGRKPVLPREEEEDDTKALLLHWVWEHHGRGLLLDVADARLHDDGGELDEPEVERALVVGLWCVHPDYQFRPSIRQAISVLQFEAPLPELPLEMPVATYLPPAGSGHGSTYTSSSWSGARSPGSTVNSGGHGTRPFVTSLTT